MGTKKRIREGDQLLNSENEVFRLYASGTVSHREYRMCAPSPLVSVLGSCVNLFLGTTTTAYAPFPAIRQPKKRRTEKILMAEMMVRSNKV